VVQETRLWNEVREQTESMRRKEEAHDYRYFPEPDLPPFRAEEAFLRSVREGMVELPRRRRERLVRQYGLSESQADFINDEKETADYFERAVSAGADPQAAATWLASDVQKILNRTGRNLAGGPLTPERLAELLRLLAEGRIHGRIAKQVLEAVFQEDRGPLEVIREKGWDKITDRQELVGIVERVIAAQPQAARQIAAGDSRPLGFLMGEVMKQTSGRADPGLVRGLLNERLARGEAEP
jgi:aspartyl-tRNA(Asn)/glutamyl-tRNA(Gln) amidotransferase subunit B